MPQPILHPQLVDRSGTSVVTLDCSFIRLNVDETESECVDACAGSDEFPMVLSRVTSLLPKRDAADGVLLNSQTGVKLG